MLMYLYNLHYTNTVGMCHPGKVGTYKNINMHFFFLIHIYLSFTVLQSAYKKDKYMPTINRGYSGIKGLFRNQFGKVLNG